MVIDAVIDWFLDLVDWLVAGVPSTSIPLSISLSWITDMNYFLPITEMFGLFLSIFILGGPMAATSLIIWVLVGILRGGATKA